MAKVPFQNVVLQTLPGGGWEINGSGPVNAPVAPEPIKEPIIVRENAKLDPAIIRAYKIKAAREGRKLYEVMEEILRLHLK
ncbi:MAG: hypothetical protein H0X33_13385 [Taibaiella sp.]|nr:hypothetical protein [Taibaiella sp.]